MKGTDLYRSIKIQDLFNSCSYPIELGVQFYDLIHRLKRIFNHGAGLNANKIYK